MEEEEGRERVRECIEETLKFTIQSHIHNSLEVELPFSTTFSSSLLHENDDEDTAFSGFQGVPHRPLYKPLASALLYSILHSYASLFHTHHRKISTLFAKHHHQRQHEQVAAAEEEEQVKEEEEEEEEGVLGERECEWSELILQKGRELLSVSLFQSRID